MKKIKKSFGCGFIFQMCVKFTIFILIMRLAHSKESSALKIYIQFSFKN
jgi:hypothetical protein